MALHGGTKIGQIPYQNYITRSCVSPLNFFTGVFGGGISLFYDFIYEREEGGRSRERERGTSTEHGTEHGV